jgi:hypothetical protein
MLRLSASDCADVGSSAIPIAAGIIVTTSVTAVQ